MNLARVPVGGSAVIGHVGGGRAFRRRLMELGVLPGTIVEVVRVAPLGDPLELRVRGCLLSVRREEARAVTVAPVPGAEPARPEAPPVVALGSSAPAAP